ncbi:hypothetical protein AB6813_11380 [bacterium RCC_150]
MKKKILAPILATLLTTFGIAAAPAAFSAPQASGDAESVSESPRLGQHTINDSAWFTKAYAAAIRGHSTAWGTARPGTTPNPSWEWRSPPG